MLNYKALSDLGIYLMIDAGHWDAYCSLVSVSTMLNEIYVRYLIIILFTGDQVFGN